MFESDARGGGKKEVFVLVGQCLDVASEVIENRLPALALLLDRMGRFAVECNAHFDTRLTWGELDLGLTITESRRCAASGHAAAPRAATLPRRRAAWLRIFGVRCSLPCDPPVGGHSCNGGMIPRFHRLVCDLRPIG